MIPIRDDVPTQRFPVVSVALIALNVLAFLVDKATGHSQSVLVNYPGYGMREVHQFVGGLTENYSMVPAQVTQGFAAAWPTIFISMFLHANWLHIGGNMLYLWIFGNNVEDTLGRFRFLVFYLVCGVAAAAAHIFTGPESQTPTIGASGAVAGLMGAYLILFPRARIQTLFIAIFITVIEVPAILVIGFWAVIQFVNATWLGGGGMGGGGVAYMAHVGGFVAGMVIVKLLGGSRLVARRNGVLTDDGYEL